MDRDRRERLRLALHVHAFLRFHGLVETLRPAAARHRPPGELVDDQHFAVLDDVVHVAVVQGVSPKELVDDVEFLGLGRELDLEVALERDLLLGRQVRISIDPVHLLRQVGQHERVVLVRRHEVDAGIGEMHRMSALIEHE